MITYIKKDVTTIEHGIVAHGVNCRGVMGSGVALAIRNKWPQVFEQYKRLCDEYSCNRNMLLGYVQVVTLLKLTDSEFDIRVANIFTQLNYGREQGHVYANIDAVHQGLTRVIDGAQYSGVPLYLPRIGCGLGGLNWDNQVGPILEKIDNEDVEIFVCDL